MNFTRCQDRSCPMQTTCLRYDDRPMEEPGQSYFDKSPRSRDSCQFYSPDTVKPLTDTQWPKLDG